MKVTHAIALLIVGASLGACAKEPIDTPTAMATQTAQGDLGKTKAAGGYQVILMSPTGEIVAGDAPFMAHVTKDGKGVEDATVNLDLTMPSMKMDGPHVELKHTTGNMYEGTATVMGSPYAAKVDVSSAAGKGTAEFDFTVK